MRELGHGAQVKSPEQHMHACIYLASNSISLPDERENDNNIIDSPPQLDLTS